MNKNKKSFTLIEVVLATFLITAGVTGAYAVVQRTLAFTSVISAQLAASYLAQEGIEQVRNARDSNWLAGSAWDEGIISSDWQTIGKFQRKITIQKPEANKMVVAVQIKWGERVSTHEVKAETELYDWK